MEHPVGAPYCVRIRGVDQPGSQGAVRTGIGRAAASWTQSRGLFKPIGAPGSLRM